MNYRRFNYEGWLYGLAFLLALGLRLIGLGAMSLNDAEASLALQALHLAQGLRPALGSHPAYILFTTPLFFLYGGGTNFLARIVPALVGSALVFAPFLFADRLKPRPCLLLAIFIALDPGLTAISRQAGSPILAITFLVFALSFLNQNKPRLAGIFGGLALVGGPAVWPGLIGLAITWAIYEAAQPRIFSDNQDDDFQPVAFDPKEIRIPLAITFFIAGTLFFIVPNGFSPALSYIAAYLGGWIVPSNIHISCLLLALPVYEPFAILLSIIAIIRGWRNGSRRVIPLSIWLAVSLLLAIFFPSRQIADLAWTFIPLMALSGFELARYLDVPFDERRETFGAIVLTVFLWIFGWLNFTSLVWLAPGQAGYSLRLGLVVGSLLLLIFSLLLVAFGWSVRIAQLGAVWGLGLGLGVFMLAGTIGSSGLHGLSHPELWWPQNIPAQAQLLDATVDDLSNWGRGYANAVPVIIVGVDSPALEWALRDHQPSFVKTLDVTSAPEIVITNFAGDPNLAATYRGQDFTWRLTTSWELAQPQNWLRWLVYREMTQTGESIILWAREDLFLNSKVRP